MYFKSNMNVCELGWVLMYVGWLLHINPQKGHEWKPEWPMMTESGGCFCLETFNIIFFWRFESENDPENVERELYHSAFQSELIIELII